MCTKEKVVTKPNSSNLLRCWETPRLWGRRLEGPVFPLLLQNSRMQTHGISLEVQRLRLHAAQGGVGEGAGFNPWSGSRSHMY